MQILVFCLPTIDMVELNFKRRLKMKIRTLVCVLVIFVFGISTQYCIAGDYDWPRWRGPNGDGISMEKDWDPEALAGGTKILWKGDVGIGYSNVSIKDNRIYTMGQEGGDNIIFCLNAETGEEIWRYSFESFKDPQSTPTIDRKFVYILSKDGNLFCLKAKNGKLRWKRDLVEENIAKRMRYGFATSPVVEGELLILSLSTSRIALNKITGETIWVSEVYTDYIEHGYYSTPVMYENDTNRYALMFNGTGLHSVEVKTGNQLWFYEWLHFSAADPVLIDKKLFLSTDTRYPRSVLLDISGKVPEVLWKNQNMRNHFSTSVHVSGYLYGSDGGVGKRFIFRCIDVTMGDVTWEKKMKLASLIAADEKLIILEEDGTLHIAEATPSAYEELSSCDVLDGEPRYEKFWTPPVLCNGKIYCRNFYGDLICIDVSK